MKRSEIENKYKWHLQDIYATDAQWEDDFNKIKGTYKQIEKFKGKLGNIDLLLQCLKMSDDTYALLIKLFVYARMNRDVDGRNEIYVGMVERVEGVFNDFSASSAYIISEVSELSCDYLAEATSRPDFKDFDFMLNEIIRTKKYILPAREEKLLSMAGKALGGNSEAYTALHNIDLPMPTLKIDGKKVKLTQGLYSYYLQSGDSKTRKTVFEGMYGAVKSLINTTAVLFANNVKKDNFYADARGAKSALEKTLYNNGVPMQVYTNLLKAVKANRKHLHDYIALRKKTLGLKTMHMYDMHIPIVQDVNMSMDYEKAYQIVLDGLMPMGQEYRQLLIDARDKGWIDVMENENKRGGAYSWGCYHTHPYVLLNYSRTTHDIFTIAHEMGHAMHTYYSNTTQSHAKHGYQIFVAEVASTVNEVLLLKHLLKTATDKKTRLFLLNYYLDMFRMTLFRQSMFAEYEMIVHDMEASGQPLTVGSLSDKYYELNKKYYGKAVRHDDEIRYEWARVPHFYTSFYVYQYATGITSAIYIAKKILEDNAFAEVYKKKFLSAGGSDSPYNILKETGVDLASEQPFAFAMQEFSDTLEELKKELL